MGGYTGHKLIWGYLGICTNVVGHIKPPEAHVECAVVVRKDPESSTGNQVVGSN